MKKNVQEINGYIYPRVKSYTIGDIFIDDKWPRLIQAINFDEISKVLGSQNFLINGVTFRLGQSNNFGFNREWKIVHMNSIKYNNNDLHFKFSLRGSYKDSPDFNNYICENVTEGNSAWDGPVLLKEAINRDGSIWLLPDMFVNYNNPFLKL